MMNSTYKDYAKLHLIVFLWGFTAILGEEISISAADVVLYRVGLSSLILALYLKLTNKSFMFERTVIIKFMLTGCVIAGHWFLFFESARVSSISVCLAGIATASFWTSLIEPIVHKRKINAIEVFLGLIVISGLYVIFKFEFDSALGLILAILSAMLAATFSVINSTFTKKHSEYGITFYEMLGATVFILLFIPLYKNYFLDSAEVYALPSLRDWWLLLILAVVCTVYAFSVSVELMKRITAFAVNLTINLEPVYGIIMALLLYGEKEQMSKEFYYGALIVLLSVGSYPLLKRRQKRRAALN